MSREIRSLDDVKKLFKDVEIPVAGVGVTAFSRLGPGKFLNNYRIACRDYTKDTKLIERDVKVFSIEKTEGQRLGRRNALAMLRNSEIREFLNSLNEPHLLMYRVSERVEKLCKEGGWKIMGNSPSLGLQDKARVRRIFEKVGIPVIPGETLNISDADYSELSEKYGARLVVQLPEKSGGKGNFRASSEQEFSKLKESLLEQGTEEVIIMSFIKGPSPSLTACVTKHGTVTTGIQHQLLDAPECMDTSVGMGVFCGHDWVSSSFPEEIQRKAYDYAESFGEHLRSIGYKGIFGLDMVMDQGNGELYMVECNPRLLGSFPAIDMLQQINQEIPLLALHIAEFLNVDYDMDIDEANTLARKPKRGAHFILYNRERHTVKNTGELEAGVYVLDSGKLVFRRPGYSFSHITEPGEFVLTRGVPPRNTSFKHHERILTILTAEAIMDTSTLGLNARAKEIVSAVYDALKLEPAD